MNKEINEILSLKEDTDYKRLSIEDILLLKEYITNLQEENKRIKKDLATYDNDLISCTYEKVSLMVTIDKAIEDIDALLNGNYEEVNGDSAKYYLAPKDCCIERLEVVKKDLLGSDSNER